jgi:hypothetical protein
MVALREHAQTPYAGRRQADFLVGLAKSGLIVGFARLDDSARQRHLAPVPIERLGAHGQDKVRAIVDRKEQE